MAEAGRVLVVADGGALGALAAVRSLGRAGWTVGVAGPGPTLAGRSRWCAATHVVPWPEQGVDEFASAVDRLGYDVALPAGDSWLAGLALAADGVRATLPFPPAGALGALDKVVVARAAEGVGLRSPPSLDEQQAPLPAVVKPRSHWSPGRPGRTETAVVATRAQLAERAAAVREAGGTPLVQPFLDGRLVAVVVVVAPDGRRLGWLQQRAEATWPTPAGVSCRATSEAPDPTLVDAVFSLVGVLGWWGVAQAQFLVAADGSRWLIDLNGRLYGSMALAIAAGLPVPGLLAAMALGRPVAPVGAARAGVAYRRLEGDLRRAWHGRSAAPLLPGGRSVAPLWARDDWRPAAAAVADLLRRAASKAAGRADGRP